MFLYLFIKNERILTENCFEGKYDVCLKINLTLAIQPQPFSSLRPAEYRRGRSKINSFFFFSTGWWVVNESIFSKMSFYPSKVCLIFLKCHRFLFQRDKLCFIFQDNKMMILKNLSLYLTLD